MKPLTAERDGFSLNAAVACRGGERRKLERLSRDGDGLVVYALKHPFRDGTTHVLFEPLDFVARLAALVPRPLTHLVRFRGLFAPNARHRRPVVPGPAPALASESFEPGAPPSRTQLTWAQRLRRVFDIDISRCRAAAQHCGYSPSSPTRA